MDLRRLEREYTCSQINWKRTLTDVDFKRRKAERRERDRMQVRMVEKIASPTLSFEVENFKLFGRLRKTETEIHNSIPSNETVEAERECIEFENLRRRKPHVVQYNSFYNCIQHEANKPRTPSRPTSVALSGIENHPLLSARSTSDFTHHPHIFHHNLLPRNVSRNSLIKSRSGTL